MARFGMKAWDSAWSKALAGGEADTGAGGDRWVAQEMEHGATAPDAGIVAPNNIIAPNNIVAPNNIIAPNNLADEMEEEEEMPQMITGEHAMSDLFVATSPAPGGPIPTPYPNIGEADEADVGAFVADIDFFG